jgi:hypothetical protein
MGLGSFLHSIPVAGNLVGGVYDQVTGQGNYNSASDLTNVNADTDAQRQLRDQFAQQYGNLQSGAAPGISAAQINTAPANQSRGVQQSGLPTMQTGIGVQQQGIGTQQQGAALQQQGAGVQTQGLDTQRQGIGVQQSGLAGLQAGFAGATQGLGTAGAAADSYKSVLSGATPSVAELSAQKLAGQNIGAQFGAAAGATGANRGLAMRTAMNNAGALGAQGAANEGIQRAAEMDAARAGLTSAAGAQTSAGGTLANVGSATSNVGQGITASGQGISQTGAGIATTGAGLAGTGQGISATGAGIVNSGTQQVGAGTAIRGQDLSSATDQASLDQNAALANQSSKITSRGQDITQQANLGNLSLGASAAPAATDINVLNQQRADKNQGQTNQNNLLTTGAELIGLSSEDVKTDIRPASADAIKQIFDSENPGDAQQASGQPTSQVSKLFSSLGGTGSTAGSAGMDPSQVRQPTSAGPAAGAQQAGGLMQLGQALSSKKVKTDVQADPAEARRMFSQIQPTTWKYDKGKLASKGLAAPATDGDDHLGVIAEDVERAGPVGKGIVTTKNGVKGLDIPMAVSALMAAVADMEKRFGGTRKAA